jgi:plasmid stabilization system protein ParE
MRYRLSSLAEADLRELWNYVAQDSSEERADKLIDAIFDRFDISTPSWRDSFEGDKREDRVLG